MGEVSPATTIIVNPGPGFLDKDDVGCILGKVEYGLHDIC